MQSGNGAFCAAVGSARGFCNLKTARFALQSGASGASAVEKRPILRCSRELQGLLQSRNGAFCAAKKI